MKFYDYFSKIYIRELWTLGTKFIVISKIYIRYNWFEIWNSCSNWVVLTKIETCTVYQEITTNLSTHNQEYKI